MHGLSRAQLTLTFHVVLQQRTTILSKRGLALIGIGNPVLVMGSWIHASPSCLADHRPVPDVRFGDYWHQASVSDNVVARQVSGQAAYRSL